MTGKPPSAVILTALPIEYKAVRAHLTHLREVTHPQGTVYERGRFANGDKSLSLAIGEIGTGNEAAALETERAIQYFKPRLVLFVGVAGGIKDVQIDDIVVATKVYQYESGKEKGGFQPRPDMYNSAYKLVQRARADARKADWLQRIRKLVHTSSRTPIVYVGPIAAGEKVLASIRAPVFQFIRRHYSDALAVEMEGHGFLKAIHANQNVDALIVRGISDLINGKKASDDAVHQDIAAQNASAFAFEVLAHIAFPDQEPKRPGGQAPKPELGKTRKPALKSTRQPVYELRLLGNEQQRLGVLYRWRMLELPAPQPIDTRGGTLTTGTSNSTTFHRAPTVALVDCSVECELRILDDGGEHSRWAGIRVRGFNDDIRFGYLVYLRASGTVELYRAGEVIGGANRPKLKNTRRQWTQIRVDILKDRIRVWVNGDLHINTSDRSFANRGNVYIHTFGTRAEFRNLRIYKLTRGS